ncbi:MAG: SpoIIE family protein phosphatase [Clostridiaceae bacterium]|nr:SpoIIE family protein phosphatase [Clostridiaceae bacterium]
MEYLSELDIFKIAISLEECGANLYNQLLKSMEGDEEKKQIFLALAKEEGDHAATFNKHYKEALERRGQNHKYDIIDNHGVRKLISSAIDFILPKEESYTVEGKGFKEIIGDALDQEYKSIKFYSELVRNINDEDIKKSLYSIIREEEQHVIKLKEMIYYKKTSISIEEHVHFIENIINGMQDWVRVIDMDDNIIYVNDKMRKELGYYLVGRKCFEVIGRTEACSQCVSKQAASQSFSVHKEEVIKGRIYSVVSSPLKNLDGEVEAIVEVLRDVTEAKKLEEKIKAQNKKHNEDLRIARKMQYSLLPKKMHEGKVNYSYVYRPCEAIGGDFFDVFSIDSCHVGVYIADVSGHGVPASMLTLFLRQTIKKDELSPAKVLEHLYKKFNEIDFGIDMYITMFYAIINVDTKEICYANAGHNVVPILFNEKGCNYLMASGIPISNWVDKTEYLEHVGIFKPGDRLVLATDGVAEICDESGEMYWGHRLETMVLSNMDKDIDELKNIILRDTYNFKYGEESQHVEMLDDMTLLILEVRE